MIKIWYIYENDFMSILRICIDSKILIVFTNIWIYYLNFIIRLCLIIK